VLLIDPAHLLQGPEVRAIAQIGEAATSGAMLDELPLLPLAA